MDNIKDEKYYIGKIVENIKFAINHVSNMSFDEFNNDEVLVNAVMFSFVQISEYANRLSDSLKEKNKQIAWNQMRAMRNKIVHNYEVVSAKIVYDTIKDDLPVLLSQLESICE